MLGNFFLGMCNSKIRIEEHWDGINLVRPKSRFNRVMFMDIKRIYRHMDVSLDNKIKIHQWCILSQSTFYLYNAY